MLPNPQSELKRKRETVPFHDCWQQRSITKISNKFLLEQPKGRTWRQRCITETTGQILQGKILGGQRGNFQRQEETMGQGSTESQEKNSKAKN